MHGKRVEKEAEECANVGLQDPSCEQAVNETVGSGIEDVEVGSFPWTRE